MRVDATDPGAEVNPGHRPSSALPRAVVLSAAVFLVVSLGFGLERGGVFAPSSANVALVAALTLAAAALLAATGLHPRTARLAPALWIGAHAGLLMGPAWGLAAALLTFATLRPAGWPRRKATQLGLLLALWLAAAFLLTPHLARRLPLSRGSVDALLLASLPVTLLVGTLLARRGRWVSGLYTAALGLIVLVPLVARQLNEVRPARSAPTSRAGRPDVVLLVLDTVRADRLSVYGYERATTPQLEEFVRSNEGTRVYPLAFSPATWTLPAHSSLFSGLLPSEHGVHEEVLFDASGRLMSARMAASRTLAENARDQGYRTAFVFANGWLGRIGGLGRGFDRFGSPKTVTEVVSLGEELRWRLLPTWFRPRGTRARQVNDELLAFLDANPTAPCLAIGNYMDAHAPYAPSELHLGRFGDGRREPSDRPHYQDSAEHLRHLSDLYDECIRSLDDELGHLFDALERSGRLRDAWVIITSDHGEAFGEHGEVEHSSALYTEVTRIPLIVKPPAGQALPAVDSAVDLLDVAQTIAGITGGPALGHGRDLRRPEDEPREVCVEMYPNTNKAERLLGSRAGHPGVAIARGSLMMLDHNGVFELFDLATDVSERHDLMGSNPEAEAALRARILQLLAARRKAASAGPMSLSREEENRLRSLGYTE